LELATLIYEESDRLMRDVFVEQLFRKEKQTWESNWNLLDQTKFVHWLCREYRVFFEDFRRKFNRLAAAVHRQFYIADGQILSIL
jgi:hypothetical protein